MLTAALLIGIGECGVVTFAHTGAGDYFAYYLPHFQTGGGAGVHFSWFNCTDPTHGRKCVLLDDPRADHNTTQPSRTARTATAAGSAAVADCATVDPAASAVVVALENRPNSYGEHDYTPSGEPFHGFTKMEMTVSVSACIVFFFGGGFCFFCVCVVGLYFSFFLGGEESPRC